MTRFYILLVTMVAFLGLVSDLKAKSIQSSPATSKLREIEARPYCRPSTAYRFVPLATPIPTNVDSTFHQTSMSSSGLVSTLVYTPGSGNASYVWNSSTNQFVSVELNIPNDGFRSYANNSRGERAGIVLDMGRPTPAVRRASGVLELFPPSAIDENGVVAYLYHLGENGAIAGSLYASDRLYPGAFYSHDRLSFQIIPSLGSDQQYIGAINDSGYAAGVLSFNSGQGYLDENEAFLYSYENQAMTVIDGIEGISVQSVLSMNNQNEILLSGTRGGVSGIYKWSQGNFTSTPFFANGSASINDNGHMVGTSPINDENYGAALIKNGQIYNLQASLSNPPNHLIDFRIYEAKKITNSGDILVKYAHRPPESENPQHYYVYRFAVLKPNCAL